MGTSQTNPSCHNPCSPIPPNTAQHEDLQSQVENFALNFFGDIVRTEINGVVNWSLPCRLDIGLPSNPRGPTEPLGCYFLRMLEQGVTGLQGIPGNPGANGRNGRIGYTSGGADIFGPRGAQGFVGNTGQQGPQGKQGPPGGTNTWFTLQNTTATTDAVTSGGYNITASFGLVTITTAAQVTLPATGTYLALYSMALNTQTNITPLVGVQIFAKLKNSTQNVDVPASTTLSGGDMAAGFILRYPNMTWGGFLTGNAGDTVGLYAQCSQAASFLQLNSLWAVLTVIRVA